MSLNKNKILLYFFAFYLQIVLGQENKSIIKDSNAELLEEVIITGTRTKRQLSTLPLPASIISKKKIQQLGSVRLNEVLNEQTGITSVSDQSGFEGIQIQGIESEYILILIDGVPLQRGRTSGNFDLKRITTTNIKQIEIVKGASSSLYGSEALGGVVNIITKKPKTAKPSGNVSYRIGTFTQQDFNIDISQKFNKISYSLFSNRFSSKGYDLNPNDNFGPTVTPFKNYSSGGKLHITLSDHLNVISSIRTFNEFLDRTITANNSSFDVNATSKEWLSHTRFNHHIKSNFKAEYELFFTQFKAIEKVNAPKFTADLVNSNFNNFIFRPEIRSTYTFKNNSRFTSGIGYQYNQLKRTNIDTPKSFNAQYIYAQYDIHLFDVLNIIVGARFDHHSEYNQQLSPKIALRYKATNNFAFKTSIGTGFKAPDFRQLFLDFTNTSVGYTVLGYNVTQKKLLDLENLGEINRVTVPKEIFNKNLKAERSISYNAGFTYHTKVLKTEVNFFRNDIKNLIDTHVIARKKNGQNVFSYKNFEEIYTTGFELNTNYKITPNLTFSGGYQLLYAFNKENQKRVKNKEIFARDAITKQTLTVTKSDHFGLINRSKHSANIKVFYHWTKTKTNFNIRILYRSKYAQFDTNGNSLIDKYDTSFVNGFYTINTTITKILYNKFDLQIGANNLLDYKDNSLPTLPGIQTYIKLNYKF